MNGPWAPDRLGRGFEQLTLPLGGDEEGDVVATVVRSIPDTLPRLTGPFRDVDVLYVHGWSDYFFQVDFARFWTDRGARFHALDLRKYGRSLRPGQTPGDVRSLEDYDADIEAAIAVIERETGRRRLVLVGHSTGALTLALWTARNPGVASALILNSPWLELQLGPLGRQAITPLINARARFDPLGTHPVVDLGFYTRAQRELDTLPDSPDGWRPENGFPTHPGWLAAIVDGHRRVAAGVETGCPTLVLLSDRSTPPVTWTEGMTASDSVLVVDDIARASTRIARELTIVRVVGAIHDVLLSRADARSCAYSTIDHWTRALRGSSV